MSFDLVSYVSKYTGRIQLDRIGFIYKRFKSTQIDEILRNCVRNYRNPELLLRKYTSDSLINENEAAESFGTDFFVQNKDPFTQMHLAFEAGLDKLAWTRADQVYKDYRSSSSVTTEQRFRMMMEASIICLVWDSPSSSASTNHIAECERIIETSVAPANTGAERGMMSRPSGKDDKKQFYPNPSDVLRCKIIRALTHVINEKPELCASVLLNLPQSCIDVPDDKINDIATVSDLVMYTVLCSMAKMGREELRRNVVENTNFREWLERSDCEDYKDLLNWFFHCDWNHAWSMLDTVCEKAKYDMFFGRLVGQLKFDIKERMMLQYCKPYQSISLAAMSKSFGVSTEELEERLIRLIELGKLSARVDGINHLVFRFTPDARTEAFEATVKAGKTFDDWTDRDIFYSNIIDDGYLNAPVVAELQMSAMAEMRGGLRKQRPSEQSYIDAPMVGAGHNSFGMNAYHGGMQQMDPRGGRNTRQQNPVPRGPGGRMNFFF